MLVLIVVTMLLVGCSLKTNTTSNGYYQPQNEVQIIQSGQPLPKDAIRIGSVETKDTGFTKTKRCTYAASMDAVVKEAKKMGGNIVYIVSVKEPSFLGSSCYYITADVYLQKSDDKNQ